MFAICSYTMAQENLENIDSLPETEKAAALLKLAKSNYTSNYTLADDYSSKALLVAEKLGQKKELGIANKYLGITDYFRRDFDNALAHYNKAMLLFEKAEELKEQANVINNIALIYSERGDYTAAIDYHKKSLSIREQQNDARGIIGSLNNIGNLYQKQGEFNKSLEYYQKAIEISNLVFPDEQFPNLSGSLAKSHAELGNIDEALNFFEKAIDGSKKNNDIRSVIVNQINLGNFYFDLGSSEKAIVHLTGALGLASQNNMEYLLGVIQLNIGNINFQNKQYEKAVDFYNSALLVYIATNDYDGQIKGLINVALCNEHLGFQDSARTGFLKARVISEQLKKPSQLAMTANYLGKNYLIAGELKESKKWLDDAIVIASTNNLSRELYMSNYNLALYWFEISKYKNALKYFEKAIIIASEMESVVFQKDAAEGLWMSHEKLDNFQQAFESLKTYNILKDSIFNDEKQKQIIAIEGKLSLNLKENQIASQKKIISQQEKILEQEQWNKAYILSVGILILILIIIIFNRAKIRRQKEKAELIQQNLTVEHDLLQLQMNPHFIFNALNSIQSFISENDSFKAEIFLSKFARLMRYYLDSSSEKWVDFSEEIQAIELNLEIEKLRLNDKFEYKVIIDEAIDKDEIQLPPMLLQPFIENAVKHGLRPKNTNGFLEVGFSLRNDNIRCYIEDDGIGREAAGKNKKATSRHKSKGVELTKKRLATLFSKNSTVNYFIINDLMDKDDIPIGTRVELIIPIKYF